MSSAERPATRAVSPLVLLLVLAVAVVACAEDPVGTADNPEPVELRFATFFEPTAAHSAVYEQWFETIEERTDGAVTIQVFASGTLVGQGELLGALSAGRIDLALFADPFYPAELPVSQIAGLPFVTENGEAHARALLALYETNEDYRREYEEAGVKVLTYASNNPIALVSRTPIERPADLAGLDVRGLGFLNIALEHLGANPVSIMLPEVYEGLQRGVVDAALTGPDLIDTLRWYEVADHFVDPASGVYVSNPLGINVEVWEGLSEDIREVFVDTAEDAFLAGLASQIEATDAVCGLATAGEAEITRFADDDVRQWQSEVFDHIVERYLDSIADQAEDPEGVVEQFLELVERFEAESDHVSGLPRCG